MRPAHHPCVAQRAIAAAVAWAAWAGQAPAAQADSADLPEPSCMLVCTRSGPCQVEGPGKTASLNDRRFTTLGACHRLVVGPGHPVVLRYRHKGNWFEPPQALAPGQPLQAVFEQFHADACGVPTRACLQRRLGERTSTTAGHGVDGLATNPAGTGNPCLLGLPCGPVLPPDGTWRFRLTDPAFSGVWRAHYLRGLPPAGMPAALNVPVAGGEVVTDGAYFQSGAVMAYRLTEGSGAVLATGEFEVVGSARLARLKLLAGRRAERFGLSQSAAWIDTLAASQLDWDVQQLLMER